MVEPWRYQVRIHLADEAAALARRDPGNPALGSLPGILARHDATMRSIYDASADYVAEAERHGSEGYPLYRWTKATIKDPKAAKHVRSFALYVGGEEVYAKKRADALEADLQPLVGNGVVTRMTKHDSNPANNPQVPAEYRASTACSASVTGSWPAN